MLAVVLVLSVSSGFGSCALTMWAAADVKAEIEGISLLLQSRRTTMQSTDEKAELALVGNCSKKIMGLSSLSNADAGSLWGNTTLSTQYQQKLCEAVDAAVQQNGQHGPVAMQRKPQTLKDINAYLTETDWAQLHGEGSLVSKATTICKRLKMVGVRSASEQTIKYCVALLLCLMANDETPECTWIFNLTKDFKKVFASTPGPDKVVIPWMKTYPPSPSDLPQASFESAYPDGKPVLKSFDRLVGIAEGHVPMRQTSKLLSQASAAPKGKGDKTFGSKPRC